MQELYNSTDKFSKNVELSEEARAIYNEIRDGWMATFVEYRDENRTLSQDAEKYKTTIENDIHRTGSWNDYFARSLRINRLLLPGI